MIQKLLKQYFGYDNFREGQRPLIEAVLSGQDVLGIMPTGAGKSICFQVPALQMDGITLVISPLISLMQDQVQTLIQAGVRAAYINSSLTPRQVERALHNASQGMYRIIYVAPERLLTEDFLRFAQSVSISMVTVDEAHCISHWGQDFRPSYAQIPAFIDTLSYRPVVSAFTATATEQVKEDITDLLRLQNPLVQVSGFDRENLYFEVKTPDSKAEELLDFLQERQDQSGIVYCATRKAVEQVYHLLDEHGYSVSYYHAGLTAQQRQQNQQEFLFDNIKIMVATNAFGMGIDKSNVQFVVHYQMPKDLESYYQEAGRAGRDGSPAHCLLLYSGQDIILNRFLIESSQGREYESLEIEQSLKQIAYRRLREMTHYATSTDCLRRQILTYFGDEAPLTCDNCGNCHSKFDMVDVTKLAQDMIALVDEMGQRFGKVMIVEALHGSKSKKIVQWSLDESPLYGSSTESPARLRAVMDHLIATGYLTQTKDQYPIIQLTQQSESIFTVEAPILLAVKEEKVTAKAKAKAKRKAVPEGREALFESLRTLRAQLASEQSVPAFVVFSDATLLDMCAKLPTDAEQLGGVSGVGTAKIERYGTAFCDLISHYCTENQINRELEQVVKKHRSTVRKGVIVLPTEEMVSEVELLDEPISISMLVHQINAMLDYYDCTRTTAVKLGNWLIEQGYLQVETDERGNNKVPTEKGFAEGITQQEKEGKDFHYFINLYPKSLQQWIVSHLLDVLGR